MKPNTDGSAQGGATRSSATPDRDGDGLADRDDLCPTEPETVNGLEDDDGCPDQLAVRLSHHHPPNQPPKINRVYFPFNSARLQPDSQNLLDNVAATFASNPSLEKVACIGWASKRERKKKALSLSRAKAVCNALTKRRVDSTRLVSVGFADQDPTVQYRASDQTREMPGTFVWSSAVSDIEVILRSR